jgi:hypothetical protein
MSPDENLTPERIAILRRMTPEERLQVAHELYWEARRAKSAELLNQHPNWSGQEIYREVGRVFLNEAMNEG